MEENNKTNHRQVFYEEVNVHQVYEQIASHFSSTRYKPWPLVEKFLRDLPDGSIGLDIGCGNGKYLAVNPNVFILGSDRSQALTKIAAQHQPHASIVADNLSLPHQKSIFDFAISIAVIHHLSTDARRVLAIRAMLETLKPYPLDVANPLESNASGGQALIYVWALEQKTSRRGWDGGHEQDVMVPWVMKQKVSEAAMETSHAGGGGERQRSREQSVGQAVGPRTDSIIGPNDNDEQQRAQSDQQSKTFQRYYHLYRSGELERNIIEAGGTVLQSGYEKDNWWAIASRQSG
ncbi:MAG: tRNA methyltransferase, has a role in tRNA modification [Pycnora praestabilis]|nr:MAG: tRNA methyltransferase, has a role in tRNA modification [Pycnora praestabilis]